MEVLLEELNDMRIKVVGKRPIPSLEVDGFLNGHSSLGINAMSKMQWEPIQKIETRFRILSPSCPSLLKKRMNFDELKKEIYQILDIIRVYTKIPGKES